MLIGKTVAKQLITLITKNQQQSTLNVVKLDGALLITDPFCPIGKIHQSRKIAVTLEPVMQF